MGSTDLLIRRRLHCRGTVQGVGFRPAVHRLAGRLALAGSVRNDGDGAQIEVEGAQERVQEFVARLPAELPPLARLGELEIVELIPLGSVRFDVVSSSAAPRGKAMIPPDARLCDACREDMERDGDRRQHYAFTTCTDCGPRFSLVRSLPYDRERTSMQPFELCIDCAREYGDARARRFHAEPLCCPACGPELWTAGRDSQPIDRGPQSIAAARAALESGEVIAVKGLGGFQLACRADDESAVSSLRLSKHRPTQPFAVMLRDLAIARRLVEFGAADEDLLRSPAAPILLARRRQGTGLAPQLAPGLSDLGVMLPTTPLHVELFRGAAYDALVMTSGNAHHEPIARGNDEALAELAELASLFLIHDREVVRRVDDSVARSTESGPVLLRRSRGYVPTSLPLPVEAPEPILALGSFLQVTCCIAQAGESILSQHIGDLDTCQARDFQEEVCAGLEEFLEVEAQVIVVDEHPDYPSTWLGERLAAERSARLMRVQHHLAHAAAVLAEHAAFPRTHERAAALVLDGTGFGLDGRAWGCEWLVLDGELNWHRAASAEPFALVGGERAVREPWRVAAALMAGAGEISLLAELRPELAPRLVELAPVVEDDLWPLASGAGRIFEAAGALFGLCSSKSWEGEAAARFESLADLAPGEAEIWDELPLASDARELPTSALLVAAAQRLRRGADPASTALSFHRTFASLAARISERVLDSDTPTLALAGGCLVNRHLRRFLSEEHQAAGFACILPHDVPAGDGGLAHGQAVLAAAALGRNVTLDYQGDRDVPGHPDANH